MSPTKPNPDFLKRAFYFAVAAFCWWRISDNTADNDLWGHVLYGQRMLSLGHLEKVDPFSWTAGGAPWINHEVLAETTMGLVHRLAGSTGLWLLSIIFAAVTLYWALRVPHRERADPSLGLVQAALLAVSVNSIALGFSVRPQLFTMLGLVLLLVGMHVLAAGRRIAFVALPLLVLVWINSHGGALAGLVLLAIATVVTAAQRILPASIARGFFEPVARKLWLQFAVVTALSIGAALLTPWGFDGLKWLIDSVRYTRPEITEWRPTPFDFEHATFWFVAVISILAWSFSRARRVAWEAAILAALLVMAIRHQRHLPLFVLANLMLTPAHLVDVLHHLKNRLGGLRDLSHRTAFRVGLAVVLSGAGIAAAVASFSPPRNVPWTIEVERDLYPTAAIRFIDEHRLDGNLLVFFDWGQEAMWDLPRNRVSFDGRLDTVYPAGVIAAHWKFYRGDRFDAAQLDLRRADVALLPSAARGTLSLQQLGWRLIYSDPLASVLVRDLAAFPQFDPRNLPIVGSADAVHGRERFPSKPSALAKPSE